MDTTNVTQEHVENVPVVLSPMKEVVEAALERATHLICDPNLEASQESVEDAPQTKKARVEVTEDAKVPTETEKVIETGQEDQSIGKGAVVEAEVKDQGDGNKGEGDGNKGEDEQGGAVKEAGDGSVPIINAEIKEMATQAVQEVQDKENVEQSTSQSD